MNGRTKRGRRRKSSPKKATGGFQGQPPEASLSMIISSFVAQALIALGELESPLDGRRHVDLAAAKFSIDLLQVLADKTKNNVSDEEKKMLDTALYDLRMQYVRAST